MNLETEVSVVHATQRRRIILLVAIMIAMGMAIGGMTLTVLYQTSVDQAGHRLVDSVKGLARLIEAIARHHMPNMPEADTFPTRQLLMEDTLNQLREAKAEYPGQGETGEFLLGRREEGHLVYLIHRRHDKMQPPPPISIDSPLGEPMRRATAGQSGLMFGLDYRGEEVLAAYEALRFFDAGIVVKIDMQEIRRPFFRAALISFGVGAVMISIGVFFFFRVSEPLFQQIQETHLLREHKKLLEEARNAEQEKAVYLDNLLRTAVDMAIVATDKNFIVKYCNPTAERLHGLAPGSAIGVSVQEIHQERGVDAERFEFGIQQVNKKGEYTYQVHTKHGDQERFISSRVSSILDTKGVLTGYMLLARDVTVERLASEAVARSERKYRMLFEAANDAIFVADTETGIILEANSMAESLLGRPLCEIIGLHQTELHPREEAEHYNKLFQEHVQGLRHYISDILVLRKDGKRIPVEIRASVTHVGEQRVILGIFRDVTERKQVEMALTASQKSLAEAQRIAHLGNWDWDLQRDHLTWSAEVYRILGMEPKSIVPSFEAFLQLVHLDDYALVRRTVEQTNRPPYPPYDMEHRLTRLDNTLVYVHQRGEIILDTFGRPLRMMGTIQDITMRKTLELRLQEVNSQLEERVANRTRDLERSNRDLQQFAYVASHDLQEPLRLVSGFVQLLEKRYSGALDEKATQYIAYVVDGVRHMDALINSLLTYARVETQGEPFVLCESERALQRSLRYLHRIIIETSATVTQDPLPKVMADEGQLAQVFQNLIANAIKFRSEISPIIHISCSAQNGEWIFSVKDNGIGIDAQYWDRIFVIFQKLHPRSRYEGTGIGLALCKRIIERHSGRIWVESILNQGSIFYFSLPVAKTDYQIDKNFVS